MSNAIAGLVGKCSYNVENKDKFKRASQKFLREVVKVLGLAKGEYDIRYNAAGIAVSGDATLHTDRVYVTFNADDFGAGGILVRTCGGRKDYTGGRNQYFPFEGITVEKFAEFVASVARQEHRAYP